MKTRILHIVVAFVLAMMALPTLAQDCMEVHFKNGTDQRYYLEGVIEVTTTRQDGNGVMHSDYDYQLVKTQSGNYTFALDEIDYISFVKYNKEQTKQDFKSAMTNTLPILADCETIGDVNRKISQIKSAPGVENAWSDGHDLFIKINNWETVSFHFNHDDVADLEETKHAISSVRSFIPKLKKVLGTNGKPLSVVIANQQHYDTDRTKIVNDYLKPLLKDFAACGFDTTYVVPTIDFFSKEIYNYDVIFLLTHGNFNSVSKKHFFATGEELGKAKKTKEDDPSQNYIDAWYDNLQSMIEKTKYKGTRLIGSGWNEEKRGSTWYWVGHPCLYEDFFKDKDNGGFAEGRFKQNSVFFSTACSSMEGNDDYPESWHSLADKFVNRGLGVYYGYSNHDQYGKYAGYYFLRAMLFGLTTGSAYLALTPSYRVEPTDDQAVLKRYPTDDTDLIFISPTHTKEIDSEIARNSYNYNQKVVVEGLTSSLNPEYLTLGFEYSTNKDFLGPGFFTNDVEVIQLLKPVEMGNVHFRAELTNLEPNQVYYCRAYTSDGRSYNYGERREISLKEQTTYPDLQVAPQKLTVEVGETVTFGITAGSGKYEAKSEDDKVATASVDGNMVSITGVSVDNTTVTIIDKETNKTAPIEVVVVKKQQQEVPAEAVDLELPSGTLWAAFNVGATKPEEYGLYFAWGETQGYGAKESHYFGWNSYKWCNGSGKSLTKYNSKAEYGMVDNKTTLDLEDDAAHANWGGQWHMPTNEQINELKSNCYSEWTTQKGVEGMLYTSKKNGKTVFFPGAGIRWEFEYDWEGSGWLIWSSTVSEAEPSKAKDLSSSGSYFYYGGYYLYPQTRYFGRSVRAVMDGGQQPTVYPDLKVAPQKLTLEVGEKVTFDITAGSGKYDAISKNDDVATASVNGKEVTIVGVSVETTTVVIKDTKTNQTAPIEIVVIKPAVPTTPAEAIDLGLPSGTKWASYNLGAAKIEDYGCYFAWGETEEKDRYKWSTYSLCDDGNERKCHNIGSDIAGTQYDAARQMWGGSWQMPDYDQWLELKENTSYSMTTINGVNCCKLTGKNGKSIYLPATGQFDDYRVVYTDMQGNYWSSSKYGESTAYMAFFTEESGGFLTWGSSGRCAGFSIRPVIPGNKPVFPDLKLSNYSLNLEVGATGTLQVTSGSGKYLCTYENNGTVTAIVEGSTISVTALKAGDIKLTISDTQSGQHQDVTVTVKAKPQTTTTCPDNNHPHLIDLGLPSGTKWACCNVGASTPEAYGEYYAWGETSTKSKYTEYNYNLNINSDIAGTSNDVAHVKWQGSWRMPTKAQAQELIDNCQYNFGKQNGVYGGKFKGPNGKVLFLPAAGFYNQAGLSSPENAIMYWTSSTSDKYATSASSFTSNRDQVRFLGLTVRPVSGGQTYPNLTLASTATLNLKTRQNSGYDITSGSGSYSVKSSNNNVATAEITDFVSVTTSQKGKSVRVVAVGVGNATITVTDNLSGQTASFNVSVTQNVDLLKLSTYSLSLKEGESGEVLITSSGNGNILIATSDASVVSFTSSGNKITVKGLKAGTCTVSVNDGQTGETANVAVTVTARQFVLSNYGPINVPSGTSYVINILNGGREGVMVNQTNNDICYVGLDVGIVAIIGVNPGKDYVTITDQKSNEEVVVEVNVTDPAVALGTPAEAVDLGLPSGTKWATFNVGAVKPADFGGFYAWGETVQKTDYSYDDYTIWSKYSSSGSRVRLSSSDDVATKLWGGSWHMPTYEQMKELVNNCSWFWTTINGVCGHLVLGSNYHVIFMPAAGTKADGSHNVANRRLTYWTSDSNNSSTAYSMYSWEDDTRDVSSVSRTFGYSVRPVK